MSKRDRADREAAESLAIQALTYLAGEPDRLGRFLALIRAISAVTTRSSLSYR